MTAPIGSLCGWICECLASLEQVYLDDTHGYRLGKKNTYIISNFMTIVIIKHYEQNEIVSFVSTFQAILRRFLSIFELLLSCNTFYP